MRSFLGRKFDINEIQELFSRPKATCSCILRREFNGLWDVCSVRQGETCHKIWQQTERAKSSTWRELAAVEFSIESFLPILSGAHVKWYTDSPVAAKIVEVGSMTLELHRVAIKIFQLCLANRIKLEIQWIPRTENEKANYISRIIDTDDWQITEDFFALIESLWGPHSVDGMANYYNKKMSRFFLAILEHKHCWSRFFSSKI